MTPTLANRPAFASAKVTTGPNGVVRAAPNPKPQPVTNHPKPMQGGKNEARKPIQGLPIGSAVTVKTGLKKPAIEKPKQPVNAPVPVDQAQKPKVTGPSPPVEPEAPKITPNVPAMQVPVSPVQPETTQEKKEPTTEPQQAKADTQRKL